MIYVKITNSKLEGSCLSCHRYYNSSGISNHPVVEITMQAENSNQSSSIRLCKECAAELLKSSILKNFAAH